ncbi:hypothetical protein A8924_7173 [Saccharopolyspora erythraea NRRL 2338]|uniref:Uncharacterized protein n=2 Tax=Saccharopolyspora erythraea TaxID=1836 RepID=A4FPK3_SACEN|nr:hypothetical protein [Saccharopolyspora erythraea]EQD85850.1 hypothetical protein N599_12775 [Saccharopolyspora erythraea D]PFG99623.1 hypothetical protein A8924_7173 [Saccharopolyspora erythraea NRRL 2338]QRK89512.1 hypothetical protein JQX30_34100 [Saccharopolyspora erythraea]CAM05978.1 hypothetical protein SACE_6814 [Saccharopolyspora erythraea NRRL 2338]
MRHGVTTALGSAVAIGLLLVPPAQADDGPTARELLEKCDNGTDSCVFHPKGEPEYFQNTSEQVGNPVFNCTDLPQTMSVSWSDTTAESNSLGLSMATSFGEVFKVTFKATYGHEWREEHTEGQTTFIEVKPGEVGRVYHGAMMQKVKGTYELHFQDKFHDHYIWYVDMDATGPADEQGGTVTQSTQPMTDEEREANCG